jgi:hypothetical protein
MGEADIETRNRPPIRRGEAHKRQRNPFGRKAESTSHGQGRGSGTFEARGFLAVFQRAAVPVLSTNVGTHMPLLWSLDRHSERRL